MAKEHIIELNNLELEISRDGKSASYPVLSADIGFSVGSFPSVSVTVSTAGKFIGKNEKFSSGKSRSGAKDILKDSPEGAIGELKIGLSLQGHGNKNYTLFCGYIATVTPTLNSNIVSIASLLTVQLICATAAINSMPGSALMYLQLGGKDVLAAQPVTYAQMMGLLIPGSNKYTTASALETAANKLDPKDPRALSKLFQQSPAQCLATLIDMTRGVMSESTMGTKLTDTLIFSEGPLKVQLPETNGVADKFTNQIAKALIGASPTAVFNSVIRQVYLTMIPQTLCDSGVPCKMITTPVNAWDIEEYFKLKIEDILNLHESTTYRLDQRVDIWCVQLPPNVINNGGERFATYGPGLTDGNGKAKCYNQQELTAKFTESGGKGVLKNLTAKMLYLPTWMEEIAWTPDAQEARLKRNLPNRVPLTGDPEKAKTSIIDVAERVAVAGYLQEGCAIVQAGLKIPFKTYLELLPYLGKMGTFQAPDAYAAQERDLDSIHRSTYYGLLSNLYMHITVERNDLQVNCGVNFSNVHNSDIHKQFCAEHPLYGGVPEENQNNAKSDLEKFTDSMDAESRSWE